MPWGGAPIAGFGMEDVELKGRQFGPEDSRRSPEECIY